MEYIPQNEFQFVSSFNEYYGYNQLPYNGLVYINWVGPTGKDCGLQEMTTTAPPP